MLVERLKPHRDGGRTPFFQAMFSVQQTRDTAARALAAIGLGVPGDPLKWETLTLEAYPLRRRIAQFDLSLEIAEAGAALIGSLEYAEDLFHAETASRMAEQFAVLLRAIVARPATRVKSLPLVSAEEARTQLDVWNRTERSYPPAATVVELWQRQVASQPDALALIAGEARLSYRELDERAIVVARRLQLAGVGSGSKVAIFLPRSSDMIASVLGVLAVGAAYVPIDPGTPMQRIAYIVQDSAATGLLTNEAQLDRLPSLDCAVLCVDEAAGGIAAPAPMETVCPAGPDAAYVIYTSGTTGRPKGVVVRHRNLLHYVRVATEAFAIGPRDRLLQFASLSFDVSVEEIFTTLTGGGVLVLRDDAMLESPRTFLARCGALGITVLDLPTAYWSELTASTCPDDWRRATALRLVLIGGEKVTVERLRRWHEIVGGRVQLLNAYGPTEATVAATFADLTRLTAAELANMSEASIGRPFPNCRVYVLDDDMKPVPIGAPGELYIGGAGVAEGYLDAPELTSSRFLPDPFATTPDSRLYRTGDKVRYLADGSLQFLGRLDQQVKIRGNRVELGEIEAALQQHPAVRAAAVVLEGAHARESRLMAYVESSQRGSLSVAELRASLKRRLPAHMVPSVFIELTAWPMSPAGKVDRHRLPPPSVANTLRDDRIVAPRNAIEARITDVWKRVLQIDEVGVHDNFFDVGGHSLLLPVLLSEIRKELDRDVAMVTLLEKPTIAASAALFGQIDAVGDLAVARGRQRASRVREMTRRQRPGHDARPAP
jgi:amino acid adenylation domain-containing protein